MQVETEHAGGLLSFHADSRARHARLNGDQRYDEAYWQARNPRNILKTVVANRIPAFLVGGWFDLFQRGEPLNYSGLQNAWPPSAPSSAPMQRAPEADGRYQLLMGPWYHVTAGDGIDMDRLQLPWFDRWLKGIDTGIDQTQDAAAPLPARRRQVPRGARATRSRRPRRRRTTSAPATRSPPTAPKDAAGADPIVFTGATSPCDRQSDQWGAGGARARRPAARTRAPTTTARCRPVPARSPTRRAPFSAGPRARRPDRRHALRDVDAAGHVLRGDGRGRRPERHVDAR